LIGGRLRDRADLHLDEAGNQQPEPDSARPQHRVLLVAPTYLVQELDLRRVGIPAFLCERTRTVRSGRNLCSGGSSSLMVVGNPSIAAKSSVKWLAAAEVVRRARPLVAYRSVRGQPPVHRAHQIIVVRIAGAFEVGR
jgi:hypothetical protein